MTDTYFRSFIVRIGPEAAAIAEAGVLILFAEPVPHELAEVSLIHRPEEPPAGDIQAGDQLRLGDTTLTITAAGDRASENLRTLGHVVIYGSPGPEQGLLPGALHVDGSVTIPAVEAPIELRR